MAVDRLLLATVLAAVVEPTFDPMFSFADLVSFTVAAQIDKRGVSDPHLRRGVEVLRHLHHVSTPLAFGPIVGTLATSGSSFIRRRENTPGVAHEWEDIGRGGQGAFRDIVEIDLRRIKFDGDGSPQRWLPVDGVLMDPRIQAGAPCIAGTRIPTNVAAEQAARSGIDDVVFDLDLSVQQVEQALAFEAMLEKGEGLPA